MSFKLFLRKKYIKKIYVVPNYLGGFYLHLYNNDLKDVMLIHYLHIEKEIFIYTMH